MGHPKGYKKTEEWINKIAESLKESHKVKEWGFKKGHKILGFKNKKHTEIWKRKQAERLRINNPMFKKDVSLKVSKTRIEKGLSAGEKNNNWKGGRRKYRGADWFRQRKKALERDNYTCQMCGKKQDELTNELTVHHIIPYYENGTNDLSNLKSVCISCHFSIEPRRRKE